LVGRFGIEQRAQRQLAPGDVEAGFGGALGAPCTSGKIAPSPALRNSCAWRSAAAAAAAPV